MPFTQSLPTQPEQPGHAVARLFTLAAWGTAWIWLAIAIFWDDAIHALTFDDAFYYFTIARHIAQGHGSTFDGIDATNGYHPLWMLLITPVYWLNLSDASAARCLLALQAILYGISLSLMGRMLSLCLETRHESRAVAAPEERPAATGRVAIVAFGLFALTPAIARITINGMESALVMLLDTGILLLTAGWKGNWLTRASRSQRLRLSALLSLAILARTDHVLLLSCVGFWTLLEIPRTGKRGWLPWLELTAAPLMTVLLYGLANQYYFDTFVQISGLVKRVSLTPYRWGMLGIVAGLAIRMLWLGQRQPLTTSPSRFPGLRRFLPSTAWFAAFCCLILGYYGIAQNQQWLWYYAPVALYSQMFLTIFVADLGEAAIIEKNPNHSDVQAMAPAMGLLMLPLLIFFMLSMRDMFNASRYSILLANKAAAEWIASNLPTDTVLGAWDAGVLGYYAHRSIINLDGVVNSMDFLKAHMTGNVGRFLTERNLAYIVNHGVPTEGRDSGIDDYIRNWLGNDAAATSTLVRHWPFRFTGTTVGEDGEQAGSHDMAVFLYRLPRPLSSLDN